MPRFVALGDSFTEGVGDDNPNYPNGVRGWADRVAKHLGKANPDWEYANLAIRSRRIDKIIAEQLEPALDMHPSLVSVFAGGNDMLDIGTDPRWVLSTLADMVSRLTATGANVVMFTSYDLKISPILEPFRPRNNLFNKGIRDIAQRHHALLIDHQAMPGFEDRRLWATDRMHMSKSGHKLMAATVLDALGVEWHFDLDDLDPAFDPTRWSEWVSHTRFWREHMVPLVGRKIRRVTLGDHLMPKWPDPIRPAKGLRKLAKRRQAALTG